MIPQKQLSLADIFSDCQNKFNNDKYHLLLEAPFEKAFIPLNGRVSLPESDCPLNEDSNKKY